MAERELKLGMYRRRLEVNWPQAFAEVLLLLAGIGLALAADWWADAEREKAEEAQYIDGLHKDFTATRNNIERSLRQTRQSNDQVLKFLEVLNGPRNTLSDGELAGHIVNAFDVNPPTIVLGTYHDMVNSGDLRLLRNGQLRLALARFDRSRLLYEQVLHEGFNQWNQIQAPFLIANLDVAQIYSGRYGSTNIAIPHGGEPLDRFAIWSADFRNILAISVVSRTDKIDVGTGILREVEDVLKLLEQPTTFGSP